MEQVEGRQGDKYCTWETCAKTRSYDWAMDWMDNQDRLGNKARVIASN
jgi:hypothetical protein